MQHPYPELAKTVLTYPAIDNHAHPLLSEANRDVFPFERLVSEAEGSAANDIQHTLAFHNASARLAELYGLPPFSGNSASTTSADAPETIPGTGPESTWGKLKAYRTATPYDQLCMHAMRAAYLETILHDDGLGGVSELCASREWHDRFVNSPCKRIVRVEVIAQVCIQPYYIK
jgi:hypothetical protein